MDRPNVRELKPVHFAPNENLLNFAESLLDRVRSGEVTGIVGALQHPGSASFYCIAIDDRYKTAGLIQHSLIKLLYEE